MTVVSKRELNQSTAAVLAMVTEGNEVIVTERGEPRWRVTAVRGAESPLARLERQGGYTPPSADPAPWPSQPGGPRYTADDVQTLLDDLAGDH